MTRRVPLSSLALGAVLLLLALILAGGASAKDKRYKDEIFKVSTKTDITYGSAPGRSGQPEELKLDLYKPKEPKGEKVKKRPAVLFVHGGGFAGGDKSSGPSPQLAKKFARMGYVSASLNYRLLLEDGCTGSNVTEECYNAAIADTHDAQAAVRWFRANAKQLRVDKKRIGIGGESAGAIIACGVAVLEDDPGTSGNPGPSSQVQGFVSISGGLPGGLFVDENSAPGILFASTGDPIVPYSWSVETRDVMQSFGVSADLVTFESDVHVPWDQYRSTIEKKSAKSIYKNLDVRDAQGA